RTIDGCRRYAKSGGSVVRIASGPMGSDVRRAYCQSIGARSRNGERSRSKKDNQKRSSKNHCDHYQFEKSCVEHFQLLFGLRDAGCQSFDLTYLSSVKLPAAGLAEVEYLRTLLKVNMTT